MQAVNKNQLFVASCVALLGADLKVNNSPGATADMKTALAEANKAAGPEIINTTQVIPIILIGAFK